MPALVNISVGSLRGTSGDDGTMAWPLSAKNFRNVDLISLTPLILVQSQKARDSPQKGHLSRAPLLDKGDGSVQKVCSGSEACRSSAGAADRCCRPVDSCCICVDSPGAAVFFSYLQDIVTSGEIGSRGRRRRSNRPGNSQANGPRDLLASGKRRRRA